MSKRFALGLVVGKFAPLHTGHLRLIDQAAAACERLLLLSWSQPEFPNCTADARRRWLAACCPQHESVVFDEASLVQACASRGITPQPMPPDASEAAEQQHFLAWLLAEVLQKRPDAMFAGETYVQPCVVVLSARLGHEVTPVLIDRTVHSPHLSARHVRHDPIGQRHLLPPAVWADWVPRICMLGGESSGKSTLALALAARLGEKPVAEYGRELWGQQGGRLEEADLLRIAQVQQAREDAAAATASSALFCDTSALTTLFYSLDLFGKADPELRQRAERPYHLHVLCEPDFPFVQDGTRRDDSFRKRQHAWYLHELAVRGLPVLRVRGSLVQRVQRVEEALQRRVE